MSTSADPRPVVVVTRRLPQAAEDEIARHVDPRFNTLDDPLDPEQLRSAMREADAVLCTVTDRIDRDVLHVDGRRARVVANFGVGVNNIDLDAAREAGIVVTNTPDVLTDDTADLAITLMLMAARRAGEGERLVRAGGWTGWAPTQLLGTRVTGKTLGIVGFGRIGRATARRAHGGFGMRVVYHARREVAPDAAGVPAEFRASLHDLLAECDVVSLHVPATPETRRMIGEAELARMPAHAILVNTARGDVVDEAALAAALRDGRLRAAGLDVYEREPTVHPDLTGLENAVLLPHLGSATEETRVAMALRALDNLRAALAGREPGDRVA